MNDTSTPASDAASVHGYGTPSPTGDGYSLDIGVLMHSLKRRRRFIVLVSLLCLLLGLLYVSLQTPKYTAIATLQLNAPEKPIANMEQYAIQMTDDASLVKSEIDMLQSRTIARRVVERLGLKQNPEFNTHLSNKKTPLTYLRRLLSSDEKEGNEAEQTDIEVVANVLSALNVNMQPGSYTVSVAFRSESPRLAQQAANAFVAEYLDHQVNARYESSRRATQSLQASVDDLRQRVIASDKAVQDFAEKHGLYQFDGRTLNDQQVTELSTQLVTAQAEASQAKARLEGARSGGLESVPEVLSSSLIQNLRQQEAELLRERSELTSQYGPKHPKMNNINSELGELNAKTNAEIAKIVNGLQNEYEIAQERVNFIKAQMNQAQKGMTSNRRLDVQLDDLKREAEANREVYNNLLASMKETGEAGNIKQASAKIIAEADLPLRKSHPRTLLILAFSLALGLCLGTGLALLLEHLNQGFLTLEAVEDNFGVMGISMVPEISKKNIFADYTSHIAFSVYAHSLRKIVTHLQFQSSDHGAKTFIVVSSVPEEGKGWLSSSLSRMLAKTEKRVLLLDCDFHRPLALHANQKLKDATLNDYLRGSAEIEQIINVDSISGMDFISSRPDNQNLEQLLNSDRMEQLMARARQLYDFIIIDSPPVLGMSDVLLLSKYADQAIFIVRWLKTPRAVVENALRVMHQARIGLAGVVMTRTDLQYYKKQEFGRKEFYDSFTKYYASQQQAQKA